MCLDLHSAELTQLTDVTLPVNNSLAIKKKVVVCLKMAMSIEPKFD